MIHPLPFKLQMQDLSNGMVKGIGREEHGLYILKSNSEKSAICGFTTRSVITQDKPSESSILWHRRLGHAPMNIIRVHKQLQHLHHSHQLCTVCPLAKHTKLPFFLLVVPTLSLFLSCCIVISGVLIEFLHTIKKGTLLLW